MKRASLMLWTAALAAMASAEGIATDAEGEPAEDNGSSRGAYYTLGIPGAQTISVVDGANGWQSANGSYPVMSAIVPTTTLQQPLGETQSVFSVSLSDVEAGFVAARTLPQCWLGDEVLPDGAFDTNLTYDAWLNSEDLKHQFIMSKDGHVFAVAGGTLSFPWVSVGKGGAPVTNRQSYVIAPCSASRPKRMFWTDAPYNSPAIDLSGKFVRCFGAASLVEPVYVIATNATTGIVTSNQVSGLRLDSNGTLTVAGRLKGQFALVYFADGNFDDVHAVEVVEIRQPYVNVMRGEIGKPLKPDGDGWEIDGLQPYPTSPNKTDSLGDYFYQHQGKNSYSAKNGYVYPIRPTVGERWNMEIWWKEPDVKGVYWPFECDHYECDWPEDAPNYVRGDDKGDPGAAITIPDDYTVLLMDYQEPSGHARLDGHEFLSDVSDGPGWSLLKLESDDDVWFLPIQSISRDDRTWFTGAGERWDVATEIRPRNAPVDGLASNRLIWIDSSIPGYIYAPETTGRYNLDTLPDAIFPVNAAQDGSTNEVIEVWWSQSWSGFDDQILQHDDALPTPIEIPSLMQRYLPVWPDDRSMPEIVLASERGSRQESVCLSNGALVYAGEDSRVSLMPGQYFPGDSGSLMLWTRRCDDATGLNAAPRVERSALIAFESIPNEAGAYDRLSLTSTESCGIELAFTVFSNVTRTVVTAAGTRYTSTVQTSVVSKVTCASVVTNEEEWLHVAVICTNGVFDVYQNGRLSGTLAVGVWSGSTSSVSRVWLGASAEVKDCRAAAFTEVAEISTWNMALPADRLVRLARTTFSGDEDGLTSYHSIRPDRDFEATGIALRLLYDRVTGQPALAYDCLRRNPGPPAYFDGAYPGDSSPQIYYRNEESSLGYNPNEEHAFITDDADGRHTVWALRNDLNLETSSLPVALVEYREGDLWRMRAHRVAVTNAAFRSFAGAGVVGTRVPGPHPFDTYWPDSWPTNIYWSNPKDNPCGDVPYRDRTGRLWFRAQGRTDVYMYYPLERGFWIPSLAGRHPPEGTAVPWLAKLGGRDADVLEGAPQPWSWRADWPTNGVPELEIGQTLTRDDGASYPDVWNAASLGVVYPDPTAERTAKVVLLTDPTAVRRGAIERGRLEACGFSPGLGGNVVQRGGKWFFHDLPPSIADRLWYDIEAQELNFVGTRDDDLGMLYLNVLSADERDAIHGLSKSGDWLHAVDSIDKPALLPNDAGWKGGRAKSELSEKTDLRIAYQPRDHYALTAMGYPDWVVLVENDAGADMVSRGSAVRMHVLKTVPRYHAGKVKIRQDPNDLLSQRLSIMSTIGMAGSGGDFTFEWWKCPPHDDGTVPTDYATEYAKAERESGPGRTSVLVGGEASTMKDLVNTYWICRFRANEGSELDRMMGGAWSDWFAPPGLAEGWLQRCLNNITPFSQRMTDLYNNAAESTVSMIAQAGPPYLGDVALNQDTLNDVGLIQLYQTLLNRAESLSLSLGPDCTNAQVNKQLLQAAERLHDLYVVLGDEAYSDAVNPTIGFGTEFEEVGSGMKIDYGACSSALFCFDNQLPTLLDEELALLRGRDGTEAPVTTEAPVFNRLAWNFTKGITAGEVAYAVNYDIAGGRSSTITAADAKAAYPQGHGDAYGHYLSALAGWYRLLRNPNFDWGTPSKGEMNVNGEVVNVDYHEEAKFSEAAAKLAKAAADIVDRTSRKAWRDGKGRPGAGYLDGTSHDNAFGYGEWAVRGGYGALCNWVVGNAILPETATNEQGAAQVGLNRIDRGTVAELTEICAAADAIARRTDVADSGLNPLGLSDDAVPFDISPRGADDGTSTHYEQIRARAGIALDNAQQALDRAQEHSNRLRMLEEVKDAYDSRLATDEANYNEQLLQVFGRPYAADVGAAGTYAQGYEGPDLYHYMWMDLAQYGLSQDDTVAITELRLTPQGHAAFKESYLNFVGDYFGGEAGTLTYALSKSGIVVKPAKTEGASRPANGEIQVAYGEFLAAYATARAVAARCDSAMAALRNKLDVYGTLATGAYKRRFTKYNEMTQLQNRLALYARESTIAAAATKFVSAAGHELMSLIGISATESTIWNTSYGVFAALGAVNVAAQAASESASIGSEVSNAKSTYADTVALNELRALLDEINIDNSVNAENYRYYLEIVDALESAAERTAEATQAYATMAAAAERLSEIVGRGNRLLTQREATRRMAVAKIAKARYNDMLFRQLRNRALSQYSSAFDLAQKYAFLAAKAYDYETGLLRTDDRSGGAFLSEIASARSLGQLQNGAPVVAEAGDGGLASALARMDVNWNTVLKGRLGLNNPQRYATWFSLRWELFRIDPGAAGKDAWQAALGNHRVADLRALPEYRRYCQPFQSSAAPVEKEPGLVIPFSSTIDFARNFFGKDLLKGDSFFDTTYFCTKIAAAGVWFESCEFSRTPSVYLVPVGEDRMRAPGQDDGSYVAWNVVDQIIPIPYAIGGDGWAAADWNTWLPSYASGAADDGGSAVRIRRYPSFRAYYGGTKPDDSMLDSARLVGRSVWNTRWLLIIPAGTLGADREKSLAEFIETVGDIRIGFKTYSNAGN